MLPGHPPATMVELLSRRAVLHGDRVALSYLDRGEREGDAATYGDLDRQARSVAACLQAEGLAGRPVLLCLPQGLDFVRCFLGCLYAGAIAAPAPGPETNRGLDRAVSMAGDLIPSAVILPAEAVPPQLAQALPGDCRVIPAPAALATPPLGAPVAARPQDIAFIQYTSGSVGQPRGIVITHGNIMANQAMIREGFGHDENLVVVNWLPLYHDMGLCGSILQPLYMGGRCITMSPLAFLQRPMRWLRALSDHGGTSSGGPNFAYELCTRQATPDAIRVLDLSRWKVAFCGSEPIRPAGLRSFAETFAPARFDARSLHPCYGLAEATLFLTSGLPGSGLRTRRLTTESVACGRTFAGAHVAILGPQGIPAADGATGEIAIAGPHVSPGFWNAATRTALPDPEREAAVGGQRFLRTGDIGAVIDGDLHILGRTRDTIIMRGTKIHATDVEATALAAGGGTQITAAAAFAVQGEGADRLVVVCEAPRHATLPGTSSIAARIGEEHGLVPHQVLLVRQGTIPRSLNGKIRRSACREAWLSGALSPMAEGVDP